MKQIGAFCTMSEKNTSVKELMCEGFIRLLQEKRIDDISISELTDFAGVGRVSFYRNFKDKDDILRYYICTETEKWLNNSEINYLSADSTQEYVIFLLEHLYQYREIISAMMRDNRMYLLEQEFDKRFSAILSGVSDPWHIAFTTGGFYKLFCYWAQTGYEKTPQEIAEYVKTLYKINISRTIETFAEAAK